MRESADADGTCLADDVIIAVGTGDILGGENGKVVVDHGEEFEAERKGAVRCVKLAENLAGAGGGAISAAEQFRRHGLCAIDKLRDHRAGRGVKIQNRRTYTDTGCFLCDDLFIGAVDVFFGALARDSEDLVVDAIDAIGESPETMNGARFMPQHRDTFH